MKIIKTRKRTEIEITPEELKEMIHSDGKCNEMSECASEILGMVAKESQYNYKKDFDDAMLNLYAGTLGEKAPNLTKKTLAECIDAIKSQTITFKTDGNDIALDQAIKFAEVCNKKFKEYGNKAAETGKAPSFKTDDDIRQEERERATKIIDRTMAYHQGTQNELNEKLNKLIRKE